MPYKSQLMDFTGGTWARSIAPQRAAMLRRLTQAGLRPDDPAVLQFMTDFGAKSARGFDDRLAGILREDELAKQSAANAMFGVAKSSDPLQAMSLLLQSRMA